MFFNQWLLLREGEVGPIWSCRPVLAPCTRTRERLCSKIQYVTTTKMTNTTPPNIIQHVCSFLFFASFIYHHLSFNHHHRLQLIMHLSRWQASFPSFFVDFLHSRIKSFWGVVSSLVEFSKDVQSRPRHLPMWRVRGRANKARAVSGSLPQRLHRQFWNIMVFEIIYHIRFPW